LGIGNIAARVIRAVNINISGHRSHDMVAALTHKTAEAAAITART
jgi:hypothetical protein